jgi:anti-sigma regulatory factor (Ser/Thr protein kinase)/tetratricopeptide (TPR) repeat protein
MSPRDPKGSRRLFVLFLASTLVPAIGLVWLGWQMAGQDRILVADLMQKQREQAAEVGAATLERILAEIEENMTRPNPAIGNLNEGAARLVFDAQGLRERAGVSLPYYPGLPARAPAPGIFDAATSLEFEKNDPAAAIRVLAKLAKNSDQRVRAEALLRLGRIYRKAGQAAQAIEAFDQLSALDGTPVDDIPAGLAARQSKALLFQATSRPDDLKKEAALLLDDLQAGKWQLNRPQYELANKQAREWLGDSPLPPDDAERLALADAVEALWDGRQSGAIQDDGFENRRTYWMHDRSILLISRTLPDRLVVLAIGPRYLESVWLHGLENVRKSQHVEFALTDPNGRTVLGRSDAPPSLQSVRTASRTRPWTVYAISTDAGFGPDELSGRTRLLLAGIAMMSLFALATGYFLNRGIARELAVARLQSDFVAAVSHEFRTPLTTMRQLSEMLARGRVSTEQRRQQFYDALLTESERLHRLVEGLLNFGRMESGEMRYQFESLNPTELLSDIVTEFGQQVSDAGYQVELNQASAASKIRADRESLARVFWNLLDNAVKYSPECHTVWVDVAEAEKRLMVRVRDRGLGIPIGEQKEIFRKFTRGAASRLGSIKGTGLGLAIARQIVDAHGGEISVESVPGQGSSFTVLLPLDETRT